MSQRARASPIQMIKIAKSDNWGDVEKDMLGMLGLEGGDDDAADNDGADDGASSFSDEAAEHVAPADVQPTPRSGRQAWGRWSHEDDAIELDLALPDGSRAKELVCEVSKDGVMRVERAGERLLHGKLALPVDRTELTWMVEEQGDGSKLLCIELPMLPIDTSRRMASVDCIFDESLAINGVPCIEPGLSGVAGKAAHPQA